MKSRLSIFTTALLISLWLPSESSAQRLALGRRSSADDNASRVSILGEALLSRRIEGDLTELCEKLGQRTAGTRGGRTAEDWAYLRLRSAGLSGVHFEDFRLDLWEATETELSVLGSSPQQLQEVIPLFRSGNTPEAGLTLHAIDAGHCASKNVDRLAEDLQGKIAICDTLVLNTDPSVHRVQQLRDLARAGAAAVLFVSDIAGALPRAGSVSLDEVAAIPAVSVSKESGAWLRRRIQEDADTVQLHLVVRGEVKKARARNVIGELPGKKEDGFLLVGAHLDAWPLGTGAVDNGSAVGVLLEAARLLNKRVEEGWEPKRPILFVLFMGEELGLHGSRAWVAEHRSDLDQIRMMLNLEMVAEPRGFYVHGHDEALSVVQATARRLSGLSVKDVSLSIPLHSDHQPFLVEGVPTMSLVSGLPASQLTVYHTAADTFDKLEFPMLQRASAAVAVLLFDLASAEETLPSRRYGPEETEAMLRSHGVWQILLKEGALSSPH